MDFVSNQQPQIDEMLQVIGVSSIEELFAAIPEELRLPKSGSDDGLSEYEALCKMESLAQQNTFSRYQSYLGGGAYEHHVPAIVKAIVSRSEFLTSYTPYQPEISQGMLQSIFEYQTAICALTGMDVANASVYDGASACAEAVLMALRLSKGRKKVLVAESLHPHYREVVALYLSNLDAEIVLLPKEKSIPEHSLTDYAAVLVQYANVFGNIDPIEALIAKAKSEGAYTIVCANPLVYGLYASAGELGADIAVGDSQPFGLSLQYGGPYTGYIATKMEDVRQLPGRIVGETVDGDGKRGFLLTLQAREQHIRREKATSNICTNQALAALSSLIAMLWYGKNGIPALALTNYQRASYLREGLLKLPGIKPLNSTSIFNEFTIKLPMGVEAFCAAFEKKGILAGIPLKRWYPDLKDSLLIAVTETKSKEQLDNYLAIAAEVLKNHG